MDLKELTAPCGLACFACPVYIDNITDEVAQQMAGMFGIDPKDVHCEGCRSERGCFASNIMWGKEGCMTKNCVNDKGLHNCSECSEFPCENLMPVADGADAFPHNTKLYNLCRIRLIGLEAWAEESGTIQKKYFKGKFVYGTGPVLEEDSEQSK